MPTAIRVIMVTSPWRRDRAADDMNGQPPHHTPGVARTSPNQPIGIPMGWFGLVLATPGVWWGGWPFMSSAARSLRHGEVTMMTLIAVGILVAYLYSVVATLAGGD